MTPERLAHFHERLVHELTQLLRAVHGDLRRSEVDRAFALDPVGDEADLSAREQIDDLALRLDELAGARALAVEAALDRMRGGEYGRCVDCGRELELERLEAIPWAERCADDQARFEREHETRHSTL